MNVHVPTFDDRPIRQAPHSLEAEQALLGAILVDNRAFERVSDILEAEHFFDPLHKEIYAAFAKLILAGKLVTFTTLAPFFETAEPISPTLTVPQYLGTLAANATTIINAPDYARTILELATRRALVIIGEDAVNVAYDSPVDMPSEKQVEELQARLDQVIRQGMNEREITTLAGAMRESLEATAAAYQRGGSISGLSTGIATVDRKSGGLNDSDVIILGARPAMGKTALATGIATSLVLTDRPKPVGFFSLEMSKRQLAFRVKAAMTGISAFDQMTGKVSDDDFRKLAEAEERFGDAPLYVDDSSGLSIQQLVSRARRMKRKFGVALIVVDYLQLINGSLYRGSNRTAEVGEISKALKGLAKELAIPLLVLSQLNREVDKRQGRRRPQLSDIRESGSIEQDADNVWLLHREEYYLEQEKPDIDDDAYAEWEAKAMAAKGKAEIILAKQRMGVTGDVAHVAFDDTLTLFRDLDEVRHG
jgi:replicative DNA helicase